MGAHGRHLPERVSLAVMIEPMEDPDLEGLVIDALEGLPEPFRDQLGSVAIVIEQEPTPAQLASVGARGLYGLYQGVPRTAYGAETAAVPSKITLFRGPLIRASPTPEALAARVTDTVYHEIAHHFGISDARLHELRDPGHDGHHGR
jgi:predicted Zn-dependent protease with MMP-like domain